MNENVDRRSVRRLVQLSLVRSLLLFSYSFDYFIISRPYISTNMYFIVLSLIVFIQTVHTVPLAKMLPAAAQWSTKALDISLGQKRHFTTVDAVQYLHSYGYLPNAKDGLDIMPIFSTKYSKGKLEKALRTFQQFNRLPETGKLDAYTKWRMQQPRCGVPDVEIDSESAKIDRSRIAKALGLIIRKKRFTMQGSKIEHKTISWRVTRFPYLLTQDYVISTLQAAFKVWEKHVPVSFEMKKKGRVTIEILFSRHNHGDLQPFDGPGGALGHAFYPDKGSDIHFDEDEPWGPVMGRNLLWVAAHEIGHSLGLKHSRNPDALMTNSYSGGSREMTIKLHQDDINGIKKVYENSFNSPSSIWKNSFRKEYTRAPRRRITMAPRRRTTSAPKVSRTRYEPQTRFQTTSKPQDIVGPDICKANKLDAIGKFYNGSYYVFVKEHYWELDIENGNIMEGFPRKISDDWNLPNNIDAFFTDSFDFTWAFKGDTAYKLDGADEESYCRRRYPERKCFRKIKFYRMKSYDDLKPGVDAVLSKYHYDDNDPETPVYFFQGPKYWYSIHKDGRPAEGFVRNVREITPQIRKVDAALYLNSEHKYRKGAYIFSGQHYFKVDEFRTYQLKKNYNYPRTMGPDWFGC